MIVGGGHLDDVGADDIGSGQRSDDAEKFATGQTVSFGRACARGVRKVEHVDLDADVHRLLTESLIIAQMLTAVQRTSDSDVNAGGLIDETFFGCPSEQSSVNGRDVPKQRKGDRMVTADRDEPGPVGAQCAPARLDLIDCLSDAERVGGNVASVDHLLCGEGLDILAGLYGRKSREALRT